MDGLPTLAREARELGWEKEKEDILLHMFLLLYADDTIICAESTEELQNAINAMSDYCNLWGLNINIRKTKVVVFSRGKIKKLPIFTCAGQEIEVVFAFKYLGVQFNYNNKFNYAQKCLYDQASRSMFALLKKCRRLMLPLDIQIELFNRIVVPVLLYACEVWSPAMTDLASKLQLRFLKISLKLGKATPSSMIYGELGQFPIEITAKIRMLCYWFKLVNSGSESKFSSIVYKLLYDMYIANTHKSLYLVTVERTLNEIGMSGIWQNQFNLHVTLEWFKAKVTRSLQDQYLQHWYSHVNANEIFYNYRLFKTCFCFEDYLTILPYNLAIAFIQFRTLNHRLPVQTGRTKNIPRVQRICEKCNENDLGDEFHYLFKCTFFSEARKNLIPKYYHKHPNAIKFHELFNTKRKRLLVKVTLFLKEIMNKCRFNE